MIASSRSLQRTLTSSASSTLWDDASVAEDEHLFNEMPKHWRKDFSDCTHRWDQPYLRGLFATLCLIAVGYASLDRRWEFMTRGERLDREHTGHIATRLTTITVTAGLLLATTATLITTDAPRADILDYTITGPYICLWASFGLLIGGAIVGSADIFVMSTSTREWTLRILMATRARVFCVLILLAYPFISIGIATLVLAFGLLAAAWMSPNGVVRIGCGFILGLPLFMAFLFVFCVIPVSKPERPEPRSPAMQSPTSPEPTRTTAPDDFV